MKCSMFSSLFLSFHFTSVHRTIVIDHLGIIYTKHSIHAYFLLNFEIQGEMGLVWLSKTLIKINENKNEKLPSSHNNRKINELI